MECSRPLLSRSGCISYSYEALEVFLKNVLVPFYRGAVVFKELRELEMEMEFSSPFIEERLYFYSLRIIENYWIRSRPLLSRSGCIFTST